MNDAVAQRQPAVPAAVERLAMAIEENTKLTTALLARLQGVLRIEPTAPESPSLREAKPERADETPLSNALLTQTVKLRAMTRAIENTLRLLEL